METTCIINFHICMLCAYPYIYIINVTLPRVGIIPSRHNNIKRLQCQHKFTWTQTLFLTHHYVISNVYRTKIPITTIHNNFDSIIQTQQNSITLCDINANTLSHTSSSLTTIFDFILLQPSRVEYT